MALAWYFNEQTPFRAIRVTRQFAGDSLPDPAFDNEPFALDRVGAEAMRVRHFTLTMIQNFMTKSLLSKATTLSKCFHGRNS